jgi:hypothetical protein
VRLHIDPDRVTAIGQRIRATRDDLAAPTFQSVEDCGSLAVRDAMAIAAQLIIDELIVARRQVTYIVDTLDQTVKDYDDVEEIAVRTAGDLGKYIV